MYQISITPEEIEKLNLGAFGGRIYVIDKVGPELDHAVRYLRRQKLIGFDTESRPSFSPGQPHYGVSLLQLSGPKEAFLFRLKHIGLDKRLCDIMASPNIIKVGAAVNDDIRGLQRHRAFEAAGFQDLQKMVWEYGIRDKSVKKMAAIILGVRISKTQQLSNWEAENLSDSQQLYAATDAWICREMYMKLLKSEKNPLTFEQMHPELAGQNEKPVKKDASPAANSGEGGKEKKKKRKRRYYKRKKKSNGKDNSEKR